MIINRKGREAYVSRFAGIYLGISLARNFLLGLFLFMFIDQLRASPAINMVTETTGHQVPAALLMASGLFGLASWVWRKTILARVGILMGAVVLMALVTSYFATLLNGTPQTGNWLVVLLTSIVAQDFTILSQPFIDAGKFTFEPEPEAR